MDSRDVFLSGGHFMPCVGKVTHITAHQGRLEEPNHLLDCCLVSAHLPLHPVPCCTGPSLLEEQRRSGVIALPMDEDPLFLTTSRHLCNPMLAGQGRVIECLRGSRSQRALSWAAPETFHTTSGRGRAHHRS
jgi:hypothetical protein